MMRFDPKLGKVEVGKWLGMVNFYQEYIPPYSTLVKPLYALTHRDAVYAWSKDLDVVVENVRKALRRNVVLKVPDLNNEFHLYADASNVALGFVLMQSGRVVSCASRVLLKAELNYSVGDKELLALVEGVKKFWHYLKGRRFRAYTDHKPLVNIMERKGLEMTGREARA